MDTRTLIKNLNRIFCKIGEKEKKYSCVWLEVEDFGGLYYSDKYILRVQAHPDINCRSCEITYIISLLNKEAPDELKHIWHVSVVNGERDLFFEREIGQLLVYSESVSC